MSKYRNGPGNLFAISAFVEGSGDEVPIALTELCEDCDGYGVLVDASREPAATEKCLQCASFGVRLTYTGREILRFVAIMAGHPDEEREELP